MFSNEFQPRANQAMRSERFCKALRCSLLAAVWLSGLRAAGSALAIESWSRLEALEAKLAALKKWPLDRSGSAVAGRKGVAAGSECLDCRSGELECGAGGNGALQAADCRLDDGSAVDTWSFVMESRGAVSIRLQSSAFAPFLFLADRNCLVFAYSGECAGAGADTACLETELPPGEYWAAANSFTAAGAGAYRLSFSCGGGPAFIRGDCNGDGDTGGVTDAITMLTANFIGGADIPCSAACDANGDADTGGVTDAIALLTANFIGGAIIPAPYPACGPSQRPGDAELGCERPLAGCR
jgi:hypothetical protein